MRCRICSMEEAAPACKYVVVFSLYQGRWLFSRHAARNTWETQGGHVEPGESPAEAAARELYEEAGAAFESLRLVEGYWAGDEQDSAYGAFFLAEISRLDPLPDSEMAEVRAFDGLPERLTYPGITPILFERVCERLREMNA